MFRCAVFFGVAVLFFTGVVPGMCQGIPGCYPQPYPALKPCTPSSPPPISRTVQVDVPLPCGPVVCGAPMPCPPNPCAPPPPRPVQVRVDVVVRPETPKPCPAPQAFCCENPPVFEPIFCAAAALVQSLIAAPLGLGERLMGHPVPSPLPIPQPVACWRMPCATVAPCFQPPQSPCPPPVRCVPQGPPVKTRPVCAPGSKGMPPSYGPFPR